MFFFILLEHITNHFFKIIIVIFIFSTNNGVSIGNEELFNVSYFIFNDMFRDLRDHILCYILVFFNKFINKTFEFFSSIFCFLIQNVIIQVFFYFSYCIFINEAVKECFKALLAHKSGKSYKLIKIEDFVVISNLFKQALVFEFTICLIFDTHLFNVECKIAFIIKYCILYCIKESCIFIIVNIVNRGVTDLRNRYFKSKLLYLGVYINIGCDFKILFSVASLYVELLIFAVIVLIPPETRYFVGVIFTTVNRGNGTILIESL